MLELANQSPWQAGLYPGWGANREMQFTLVVKLAWRFALDGSLTSILPASPLELADRHHGDPLTTSLAAACEIVPFKQGAEVLLTGTAHPPLPDVKVMTTELGIRFPDGREWRKTLRVCGERVWRRGVLGTVPSAPEPLTPIPLQYEYAFGGVDKKRRALDTRNPVGRGFAFNGKVAKGQPLPQIEKVPDYVIKPADHVDPAGYGPIPAGWAPRYQANARFDEEAAMGGGCPYPVPTPLDLFHAAAPDQRFGAPFTGGERITLRGFFAEHGSRDALTLELPTTPVQAFSLAGTVPQALSLVCDTLLIDTDRRELCLLYRAGIAGSWLSGQHGWVVLREGHSREAA